MVECSFCGKQTYMPFGCKYCGKQFCSEHRLPENHKCKRMELIEEEKASIPSETYVTPKPQSVPFQVKPPSDLPEGAEIVDESYNPETGETTIRYFIPSVKKPDKPLWGMTSVKELKHLTIGVLLMLESVFLMFVISFWNYLSQYPSLFILIAILGGLVTIGFIGHELSHKFSSIILNHWAEFRLTKWYAVMTAIIPYFVMPGAVQVASSRATEKDMGRIAIAGPLFNFVLGIGFMLFGLFFQAVTPITMEGGMWWIFGFSAFMNVMLGLFNLIPVYVLDGKKIITWNKGAWLGTLLALIGLAITLWVMPWGPGIGPGAIFGSPPRSLY